MKTTIKLISLAALAVGSLLPVVRAADQDNLPPPRMQERREARMKLLEEKLNLTAEQKTKINAIWDQAGAAAREKQQQQRAEQRALRKEQREAMKATRDQVRAVLTPEQQKIFDDLPASGPGRGPGRGHGRGPGGPGGPGGPDGPEAPADE